jgi:hypothetical protein
VRCLSKAATRGIPALPTSGFLLQIPPPTPQYTNFTCRMTTGQMTCASGADDVSSLPFRKLRFQMTDNMLMAIATFHGLRMATMLVGSLPR